MMKTSFSLLLLFLATSLFTLDLTVSQVTNEGLEAQGQPTASYKLGEIYDVYAEQSSDTPPQYRGYIDSVYLTKIGKGSLFFEDVWVGEKKYLKTGYFLVATGRIFGSPELDTKSAAKPQAAAGTATTATSNEGAGKILRVDGGAGLTFGLFDTSAFGSGAALGGLLATLLTTRAGADVTLRIQPLINFSFGADLGAYTSTVTLNSGFSGSVTLTFLDLPLRGFFRVGSGGTYIEGYGGYLLTSVSTPSASGSASTGLNGLEFGARASAFGMYAEYSYVFGSATNWSKVGAGISLTDLLTF